MHVGKKQTGFTIVELLIVIVVIGILAALVLNAFSNAQAQARDGKRKDDIAALAKALELYYLDHGQYPTATGSTTPALNSWNNTADPASWQVVASALKPYMGEVPSDPTSTPGASVMGTGVYDYAYFSNQGGSYCGTAANQMFIPVYRLETSPVSNTLIGNCTGTVLGPYGNGVSNYRKTQL